jgi:hypothetical protein
MLSAYRNPPANYITAGPYNIGQKGERFEPIELKWAALILRPDPPYICYIIGQAAGPHL